jgi:hypothetical protein
MLRHVIDILLWTAKSLALKENLLFINTTLQRLTQKPTQPISKQSKSQTQAVLVWQPIHNAPNTKSLRAKNINLKKTGYAGQFVQY